MIIPKLKKKKSVGPPDWTPGFLGLVQVLSLTCLKQFTCYL